MSGLTVYLNVQIAVRQRKVNNYYFSKSARQIAACKHSFIGEFSLFAHNLLYFTEGRDIVVTWQTASQIDQPCSLRVQHSIYQIYRTIRLYSPPTKMLIERLVS